LGVKPKAGSVRGESITSGGQIFVGEGQVTAIPAATSLSAPAMHFRKSWINDNYPGIGGYLASAGCGQHGHEVGDLIAHYFAV